MIEKALDHFVERLSVEHIRRRVSIQLGSPSVLEGPTIGVDHHRLWARPLGVVLHVVADNVFFGPAESLLAGLVTGNVNISKQPGQDAGFLSHFVRSLLDALPEKVASTAVLPWQGGNSDIEAAFAERVDGIVIAGSASAVQAYRRLAGPGTTLVEFGPRISIAVISTDGRAAADLSGLARDVALWEQSACTSAQCVYVESDADALSVAEQLFHELQKLAAELPEGAATVDERLAVFRFRERALCSPDPHRANVFAAPQGGLTTVVFQDETAFRPTPLRRCVWVRPYDGIEALTRATRHLGSLLQTVGLGVAPHQELSYRHALATCGARRFCPIGQMSEPDPTMAHDGMFELARLVRFVATEAAHD